MKAIRVNAFGGPEVLTLEDISDPIPATGQILVKMHAIGVNPVDAYIRSGTYPRLPSLPYTPGTDGAGIVQAIGSKVGHFKAGDRVYIYGSITGAYAELALCESTH